MRTIAFLLLATLAIPLAAQNLEPSTPQGEEVAPLLHTSARLVSVDVVVTDSHGNPVSGLSQADFTIRENKADQRINSFDEHRGGSIKPPLPASTPGTFTNAITARGVSANVLLIDWLNTQPSDQQYMRDQLVKFLNAEQPDTRTAIFALGTSLHLLQDFTSDQALLKAAVFKQGVRFSPLLQEKSGTTDPTVQDYENAIESSSDPNVKAVLAGLQSQAVTANFRQQSGQTNIRIRETLSALSEIARYLAGGNMRKNLIWVSGSFPITIQRDAATTGDPYAGSANLHVEFEKTVNLLADSRVAVYPIDPSGIALSPSATNVDSSTSTNLAAARRVAGSSSFTPADDSFDEAQLQQHTTMENLAESTGGRAVFNSNDLVGAFGQAVRNGSEYYTLTYVPPGNLIEGGFRPIDVKVNGRGLHASFRHGYYAAAANAAVPAAPSATLNGAMNPLVPQSSEILFNVQPLPSQQPTPGKTIGEAATSSEPHSVYSLNMVVDVSTLNFIAAADGKMHASIDFATVLYDARGKVVDSRSDHANLALDPDRYRGMIEGGLRFHHNVALTAKGDQSVRIAVHDATTDRIGTLQLTAMQITGKLRPKL